MSNQLADMIILKFIYV